MKNENPGLSLWVSLWLVLYIHTLYAVCAHTYSGLVGKRWGVICMGEWICILWAQSHRISIKQQETKHMCYKLQMCTEYKQSKTLSWWQPEGLPTTMPASLSPQTGLLERFIRFTWTIWHLPAILHGRFWGCSFGVVSDNWPDIHTFTQTGSSSFYH